MPYSDGASRSKYGCYAVLIFISVELLYGKYLLPRLDDNGDNMAFYWPLIKRMVPDAASSEDGAGEHTKQMSIEAMQLQAYGRDVRWGSIFYLKNYSVPKDSPIHNAPNSQALL